VAPLTARVMRRLVHEASSLRWRMASALTPRRRVEVRGVSFTLPCDNRITDLRWRTYVTKEPETLDWIDGLRAEDVLFDVGANIGLYSLYAARRHRTMRVIAFEPEYANLHLLRDNIVLNGLGDRIEPYALALGDRSGLSRLHLSDFTPGAALHTEDVEAPEPARGSRTVVGAEGICVMRMDDVCDALGVVPSAIKIDVDGNEDRVVEGAVRTLGVPALRTVLIELTDDAPGRHTCTDYLEKSGLRRVGRFGVANEIWRRPVEERSS
jgi:FkbM family methyltransferase